MSAAEIGGGSAKSGVVDGGCDSALAGWAICAMTGTVADDVIVVDRKSVV